MIRAKLFNLSFHAVQHFYSRKALVLEEIEIWGLQRWGLYWVRLIIHFSKTGGFYNWPHIFIPSPLPECKKNKRNMEALFLGLLIIPYLKLCYLMALKLETNSSLWVFIQKPNYQQIETVIVKVKWHCSSNSVQILLTPK